MIERPLDGLTVVTLEHVIAAPFCTRQLADLGARVIKIERHGVGDFARAYDERVKGLASHFVWTNRSKLSPTLDVRSVTPITHPHVTSAYIADRRVRTNGANESAPRPISGHGNAERYQQVSPPTLTVIEEDGCGLSAASERGTM